MPSPSLSGQGSALYHWPVLSMTEIVILMGDTVDAGLVPTLVSFPTDSLSG
jgi:hypothetical protein